MEDLVALSLIESEINTTRRVWVVSTKAVIRITNKMTTIEEQNDKLQDEIHELKLKKLRGDESFANENLIKDLEQQIEENKEVYEQERTSLRVINRDQVKAENEIEEI
jgi:hypothetical protein